MIGESQALSMLKRSAFLLLTSLFFATPAWKAAHAAEPAQDEALAYAAGVQAYINWGKGAGFIFSRLCTAGSAAATTAKNRAEGLIRGNGCHAVALLGATSA
jgi:hypothetical protein